MEASSPDVWGFEENLAWDYIAAKEPADRQQGAELCW